MTHEHLSLLDLRAVASRCGCKRTKLYADIKNRLMTPPVTSGKKFSRWPDREVDAVIRAKVAGLGDDAIRRLVDSLVAKRGELSADA